MQHGRDFPWRRDPTPYRVVVSEIMLQQTQVGRVERYFADWMRIFPDFETLAASPTENVLRAWQGMGYNRRALWLRAIAKTVQADWGGELPRDPAVLKLLPGVGTNTAGSIAAFAFQVPAVFIETNIRRVYLHEFFPDSDSVLDRELLPLIEATMDKANPRKWYWALMDYGAYLGRQVPNPNRRSAHYTRQGAFVGSTRELRGRVVAMLLVGPRSESDMMIDDARLGEVLGALCREGFARYSDGRYSIA
ncbi:MAG TPA: A/G-specific adenine glycosylase [Candidatus Saccharimonadia bacterium]|nr:A/G-specific adenine glycosylase [Candidatus Saccharimonadia bacterium]